MKRRVSLRWRLILISWSLALGTALALGVPLFVRSQRQLLQQLEKTLETKCDEVITVLEAAPTDSVLEDFLLVETKYRYVPYTYFYQILDGQGGIFARSQNLGESELPIPEAWKAGDLGSTVLLQTEPNPVSPEGGPLRLRSERVQVVAMAGRERATIVIQTAVSLGTFESTVRRTRRDAILVAAFGLGPVFFLLWFVTTRSLRPVAEITRKASQITGTNLRERLPLAGRADELDELARVLNDMLDRLDGSLRQMEHFSSGAAHQLRTHLTRIRGELDLILRSDVSDPLRSQLERIQEELEGLSRVCGRLLLLARLGQQGVDTSLLNERVDLEEVVSELLELMGPLAQERGVALSRGTTSRARIRGSRSLVVEALLNLLDNAIHATPAGGSIAVSIEGDGDAVRLSVEDSGPGVPAEERERIFQPFYRIPRASAGTTNDGTGLGLAIVRGIAQAHGGRAELGEGPRGGCVARLVLPAVPAP